jgi:hypothetical protein
MKTRYLIIISVFLCVSCSSWKEGLISQGSQNDAVLNAIHDFLHTENQRKKYNVFSVYLTNINDDLLSLNIGGNMNPILVVTEDRVKYSYDAFPTCIYEQDGKLFYWDDSTKVVTDDVIATFRRYNLVDTAITNTYIPDMIIDDSGKGVGYFFCRNNLLRYKKVHSNKEWYKSPKLKCDN